MSDKVKETNKKVQRLERELSSLEAANRDLCKSLVIQEKETLRAQASLTSCMALYDEVSADRNKYSKHLVRSQQEVIELTQACKKLGYQVDMQGREIYKR